MRTPALLLLGSITLSLTAPASAKIATRPPRYQRELAAASHSSSSSSSSVSSVISGKNPQARALLRKAKAEWKKRATEGRPIVSSSSSSLASGAFTYQPYAGQALGDGQKSLLYFYAPWAAKCQGWDKILTDWAAERGFMIPVYRVDYDTAKAFRKTYGVLYASSFVYVNEKGALISLMKNPFEAQVKQIIYQEIVSK